MKVGAAAVLTWFRLCLLAQCAMGGAGQAAFGEDFVAETEYVIRQWRAAQGMPDNLVTALHQSRDNFLWVATGGGVVRFDGVEFDRLKVNPRSVHVKSLTTDAAGDLWSLGFDGTLSRLASTARSRQIYPAPAGAVIPVDQALALATDGRIWVRRRERAFSPGVAESEWPGDAGVRFADGSTVWATDFEGCSWRVGRHEVRWTWGTDTGVVAFPATGSSRVHLLRAREGMWLVGRHAAHRHRGGERVETRPLASPPGPVRGGLEDGQGRLWLVARNGLLLITRDGELRRVRLPAWLEGRGELRPRVLLAGREGCLWLGLAAGGLLRLRPREFERVPTGNGEGEIWIDNLGEDPQGRIWVAGGPLGLGMIEEPQDPRVLQDPVVFGAVNSVRTVPDGVWVVSPRDELLFRSWDGRVQRHRRPGGGGRPSPLRVFQAGPNGDVYVGGTDGLYCWGGEAFVRLPDPPGEGSGVVAVGWDEGAGVIAATVAGGLYRWGEESWGPAWAEADGLEGSVVSLQRGLADRFWIGLGSGFACRKAGRLEVSADLRHAPRMSVRQIVEDGRGHVWMAGNRGVWRVAVAELEAEWQGGAPAYFRRFGEPDGLPAMVYSVHDGGGNIIRDHRDHLWFATPAGVLRLDPDEVEENSVPPQPLIEQCTLDGSRLAGRELMDGLRLPAGAGRLEVHYVAAALRGGGQLTYQVKLAGRDLEWMDAGADRVAVYHDLPPGEYAFQVRAANECGVWSSAEASLAVVQLPYFWQTGWFGFLFLGGLGALAGLFYHRRVRHLHREARHYAARSEEVIRAQETERRRIARELHDGVGQNLIILKNQTEALRRDEELQESRRDRLHDMGELAAATIQEIRGIAYGMRPPQIDQLGLTRALRSLVRQMADSSGIPLEARIESLDEFLKEEDAVHLYRVVQEGLNNLVKHSECSQAELRTWRTGDRLRVRLSDDGRGGARLVPETRASARSGGLGLAGMAERVRILGGRMEIDSRPTKGTVLEFAIPLAGTIHEKCDDSIGGGRSPGLPPGLGDRDRRERAIAAGGAMRRRDDGLVGDQPAPA